MHLPSCIAKRLDLRCAAAALAVLLAACSETPVGMTEARTTGLPTVDYLALHPDAGALPNWFDPQSYYATGDVVRTITGANNPTYGNCGINTGIAFDGTNLIMSCYYNNRLDILDPADGSHIAEVAVSGVSGLGALAWDNSTSTLWACAEQSTVVQIELSTGTVLSSFPASDSCLDGLAYDGTDGTIYTSGDVHNYVYNYTTAGALIATHYVAGIIGGGNSGIAAGGQKFYLASNPAANIYELERDFSTGALFATVPRRVEDMECDDVTFAPTNAVIWQQDAYDRIIQAFEIPAGACPFGGGPVQVDMQVRPSSISVTRSSAMQIYLLSDAGFDAAQAEAADARLVVDGTGAGAAVMMAGANYYTSTRDFDGDGDVDRLFYFRVSDVVAAGLSAGATTLQLQDHTGVFQYDANPVASPTILP